MIARSGMKPHRNDCLLPARCYRFQLPDKDYNVVVMVSEWNRRYQECLFLHWRSKPGKKGEDKTIVENEVRTFFLFASSKES